MIQLVCPRCSGELFKTSDQDCIEILKDVLQGISMRRRKTLIAYDLSYNLEVILEPLTCMICGETVEDVSKLKEKVE